MKTPNRRMALAIAVGITIVFCLTTTEFVSAEGGRMVRIYGSEEKGKFTPRLEPEEIWLGRQTTLVWVNMSDVDVKIIFPEGQSCKTSSAPAKGWKLDKKACYITSRNIPPGGTSSIYFTRVGGFDYDIEYVGKSAVERGKIVVRTVPKGVYGEPAY
jgi:hypothetical protein